jgi:DNA-binding MarR family transcriptional regulator
MLDILERRGLVTRQCHPSDGRARTVELTTKGLVMWKKSIAATEPVRERLLAAFRPAKIHTVFDILGRIAEAMDFPNPKRRALNTPPDKIKPRRRKPESRDR